jgi:beta-phosphoglucomutase-like phosphatase (HAD superfamily)
MRPSPTVCFDLDGVLVDTEPIWERVRRSFAERHGGLWTSDLQERMMGVQTSDWSTALSEATAIPTGEHRPGKDVLRWADAVLDDITELTPAAVSQLRRG